MKNFLNKWKNVGLIIGVIIVIITVIYLNVNEMKEAEASIISNKVVIEKIDHNFMSRKYHIYLSNGKDLYVHSRGSAKHKSWPKVGDEGFLSTKGFIRENKVLGKTLFRKVDSI